MSLYNLFQSKTKHRPDSTFLIYVNASNFGHVVQHVVKRDPGVMSAAKERAHRVFSASQATELPAEGKYGDECRYCPYTRACGKHIESIETNPTRHLGQDQNFSRLTTRG